MRENCDNFGPPGICLEKVSGRLHIARPAIEELISMKPFLGPSASGREEGHAFASGPFQNWPGSFALWSRWALLVLACALVLSAEARKGAREIPSASLLGRNYLRLADWARANNFEVLWLKQDEIVQVANHSARLVFEIDSRSAEINGASVKLCYPVLMRNGLPCLTQLDADATLRPLLHPARNRAGSTIRNIVLDPGHGGRDPGNQDGAHQEKRYTLLLAQELADQLKRAGFRVSLTRTTDTLIDLPNRPDIARRRGADLFISLHWNSVATGRSSVKGAQTYCLTPAGAPSSNADAGAGGGGSNPGNRLNDKNILLAYEIQTALRKDLGTDDQGVRRARFWVLRDATMPAVLIEGGYMSHPSESKHIYDPAYRKQMARAILEGIQAYKTQVEQSR
jgi:N-acetylmuramoyl-L-alanine amidase